MRGLTNTALSTGRRVFISSAREQSGGKRARPERGNNFNSRGSGKVYVGNLKYEVSWQNLKDHMRQAGRVLKADVLQDATGRSKGCGIVEYESARDAANAIATLNDTELNGRLIFVREDREHDNSNHPSAQQVTRFRPQASGQRDTHAPTLQSRQSRTVYVGNLSYDVTWQNLKDHMGSLGGIVEHADVLLGADGRSKGCGLVTFATQRAAETAINQLTNTQLNGRPIFVREDRETGEAKHGGSNSRLYVGNLDYRTEWYELKDHFRTAGNVTRADVIKEPGSTRSKGFGIVEFASAEEAANAMATLNNSSLLGREIFVREDRDSKMH